jgi:hypothetical protein
MTKKHEGRRKKMWNCRKIISVLAYNIKNNSLCSTDALKAATEINLELWFSNSASEGELHYRLCTDTVSTLQLQREAHIQRTQLPRCHLDWNTGSNTIKHSFSSSSFPFPFVPLCAITASGVPRGTFVSMNRFSTLCGWLAQRRGGEPAALRPHAAF